MSQPFLSVILTNFAIRLARLLWGGWRTATLSTSRPTIIISRATDMIIIDIDTKRRTVRVNNEFDESKINRDGDGKFAPKDTGASGDHTTDTQDVFGESFGQFSGRPSEAIEKLLWEKRGHVPAAISKDGVGDIDFVWGEDGPHGYGLAHIIERRNQEGKDGVEFAKSIPGIIKDGTVDFRHQKLGRLYITSKDKNVVIRLDWNGIERNWLATAFEIYK